MEGSRSDSLRLSGERGSGLSRQTLRAPHSQSLSQQQSSSLLHANEEQRESLLVSVQKSNTGQTISIQAVNACNFELTAPRGGPSPTAVSENASATSGVLAAWPRFAARIASLFPMALPPAPGEEFVSEEGAAVVANALPSGTGSFGKLAATPSESHSDGSLFCSDCLQHSAAKRRSSSSVVIFFLPPLGASSVPASDADSSSASAASSSLVDGGVSRPSAEEPRTQLLTYFFRKLKGHPVLHATLILPDGSRREADDEVSLSSQERRAAEGQQPSVARALGIEVWGDPERLLLLLEEGGGFKKTLSGKFAPFKRRCRGFFVNSDCADLFLTPHEEASLIAGEIAQMKFGGDAPFCSLRGLGVLEVCVAGGLVGEMLSRHQTLPLRLLRSALCAGGAAEDAEGEGDSTQTEKTKASIRPPTEATWDALAAAYFGFPAVSFFFLLRCLWRMLFPMAVALPLLAPSALGSFLGPSLGAATSALSAAALPALFFHQRGFSERDVKAAGVCTAVGAAAFLAFAEWPSVMAWREAFIPLKAEASFNCLLTCVVVCLSLRFAQSKVGAASLSLVFLKSSQSSVCGLRCGDAQMPALRYSSGLESQARLRRACSSAASLNSAFCPAAQSLLPRSLQQSRLRLLLRFGSSPDEKLHFTQHPLFSPLFEFPFAAACDGASLLQNEKIRDDPRRLPCLRELQSHLAERAREVRRSQGGRAFAAGEENSVSLIDSRHSGRSLPSVVALSLCVFLTQLLVFRVLSEDDSADEGLYALPWEALGRAATAALRSPSSILEYVDSVAEWGRPLLRSLLCLCVSATAPLVLSFFDAKTFKLCHKTASMAGVVCGGRRASPPRDWSLRSSEFASETASLETNASAGLLLFVSGSVALLALGASALRLATGVSFANALSVQLAIFFALEPLRLLALRVFGKEGRGVAETPMEEESAHSAESVAKEALLRRLLFGVFAARVSRELSLLCLAGACGRVFLPCVVALLLLQPLRFRRLAEELLVSRRASFASGSSWDLVNQQTSEFWLPSLRLVASACLAGSSLAATRLLSLHDATPLNVEFKALFGVGIAQVFASAAAVAVLLAVANLKGADDELQMQLVYEIAERELISYEFGFALQSAEAQTPRAETPASEGQANAFWKCCLCITRPLLSLFYPLVPVTPGRSFFGKIANFSLPPLFPVGGAASSLPILRGGLRCLDRTLFLPRVPFAEVALSDKLLEQATTEFLERGKDGKAASVALPAAKGVSAEVDFAKVLRRFSGRWTFDPSRSTSMSPVSEHLGVSWVVRNAVERFRPELEYKIDGPDVSITTFLTAGISKTIKLRIGGSLEQSDGDVGSWSSSSCLNGTVVETVQKNKVLKATLYETRRIEEGAEGPEGDYLVYRVRLQKEGLEAQPEATRVFKRLSGPSLEGEALAMELAFISDNLTSDESFEVTSSKGLFQTFKCTNYSPRFIRRSCQEMLGVARVNLGKVNMDSLVSYLSVPENRRDFDSAVMKIATLKDFGGCTVVYQAFKGQWGFSGRDFVIACWSHKEGDDRVLLTCESIDWNEPVPEEVAGLVRAELVIAGYDIKRREDGDVQLTFVLQADLKTTGLPQWINLKVKTEQLTVVQNIKGRLEKCKA